MERLLQRVALLVRAETLAMRLRVRRATRATVLVAAAFAAGLFAFGFVNYCVYMWIAGVFGQIPAALSLAAIDVALAALCMTLAVGRGPSQEEAMVEELRAMALAELETDAQELKDQLVNLQQHVARISDGISKVTSNDPLQLGLSSIGPIVSLIARLIQRKKND